MSLKVSSVSLGSSSRNHETEAELLGKKITIKRTGTDGDIEKACRMVASLDGHIDAFGLGGIDFYLSISGDKYPLPDAFKIAAHARKTPMVDGFGVKNLVEDKIAAILTDELKFDPQKTKIFFVCAMNRALMAESLEKSGFEMIFGDFMSATKMPVPVYSLKTGRLFAKLAAPFATRILPYRFIYPVGNDQNERKERFGEYFRWADIIAGDFNYINRHAPLDLGGKTIITTSVTEDNARCLKDRGVKYLVTTYPRLGGRAFGANVIEAAMVALAGKNRPLMPGEYMEILQKLNCLHL